MKINKPSDPWLANTLEEVEWAQLRKYAARSFRDNLAWLEEMTEFAEKFSKAPARTKPMPNEQTKK